MQPLLIVAQSGRFLAQAAQQLGYQAWVIDCFADMDTRLASSRWQAISANHLHDERRLLATIQSITQGQACSLIYGSGVEKFYPIIERLPDHIQLVANTTATVKHSKTPALLFPLLKKLGIAHPSTRLTPPPLPLAQDWLLKSAFAYGGAHIRHLQDTVPVTDDYFQRFITGQSGSCLFLANRDSYRLILINKQYVLANSSTPFQLSRIETPLLLPPDLKQQLERMVGKLVTALGLAGLNSLDFIISEQNELLLTEINPRPSASAELSLDPALMLRLHIEACQQAELPGNIQNAAKPVSLHYHFAKEDYVIADNISWPAECHDIPPPASYITQGHIFFSSLITNADERNHDAIEKIVTKQLVPA